VLELTNRFDWGVGDKMSYASLFQRLATHPRFHVVANNPYEEYYIRNGFNVTFSRLRVLRPSGITFLSEKVYPQKNIRLGTNSILHNIKKELPKNETDAVVYKLAFLMEGRNDSAFEKWSSKRIIDLFDENKVKFHFIPFYYGGPKTLTKYRAFIDVPYQFSTMKLYENLAHGVVMLIPTARLCTELSKVKICANLINFKGFHSDAKYSRFKLGGENQR
jgi:hypothetical protein